MSNHKLEMVESVRLIVQRYNIVRGVKLNMFSQHSKSVFLLP